MTLETALATAVAVLSSAVAFLFNQWRLTEKERRVALEEQIRDMKKETSRVAELAWRLLEKQSGKRSDPPPT